MNGTSGFQEVRLAILLIAGLAITACTVAPKMKYLTDTTSERSTMFHLVDGSIVISQTSDTEEHTRVPVLTTKNDVPISDVSVTVVPREYSTHLYGFVPQSQYLGTVDTNISSTFYDNSRVVHKLGVEVVDNRLKTIEAIGAIAGAAAKFALMDSTTGKPRSLPLIAVPVVLNPSEETDDKWHPLPGNEAWAYRIETKVGDEKDAVLAEDFFKKYDVNGWFNATSAFPISSCKEVRLELSTIPIEKLVQPPNGKRTKAEIQAFIATIAADLPDSTNKRIFVLKVPEPQKVRTISMPPKGEITTHTLCGANTATQPSSAASTYDVLSALMKQAQAVYEAQKANTK